MIQNLRRKQTINEIALGGILSAITALIAILASIAGYLDIILYLSITPITIATVKAGIKPGILVSFASTVLVGLILGIFPASVYFAASVILPGLTLGVMFQKNKKPAEIILAASASLSVSLALTLAITSYITGISLSEDIYLAVKTVHSAFSAVLTAFPESMYAAISIAIVGGITAILINKRIISMSNIIPSLVVIVLASAAMTSAMLHFSVFNLEKILISERGFEAILRLFYEALPFFIITVAAAYSFYLWIFNYWILTKLKLKEKLELGVQISSVLEYPQWFAHIAGWSGILLLFGYLLGVSPQIKLFGDLYINAYSALFINVFLIFAFLFFIKGTFILRDFIFAKFKTTSLRVLALFLLMTLFLPVTVIIGWHMCLTGSKAVLVSANSPNPAVSPNKISLRFYSYKHSDKSLKAKKRKDKK